MSNWTFKWGPQGGFMIDWKAPNGLHVSSYPLPKKPIYWLLYPYIFYRGVKAVVQHRHLTNSRTTLD